MPPGLADAIICFISLQAEGCPLTKGTEKEVILLGGLSKMCIAGGASCDFVEFKRHKTVLEGVNE